MTFVLPIRLPWWARLLGLELDWQSRPWQRQRTYHSRDRRLEVTVGRGQAWWALEIDCHEDKALLHLAVPGVHAFVTIGPGRQPPVGDMAETWGVSTFERTLRFDWGKSWSRTFELNPFRWNSYVSERLRLDGEWDSTAPWLNEGGVIEWYQEDHPYLVTSEPIYRTDGPHAGFSVETWQAEATCYVHRTTRRRRWLPWWKKVEFYVDVRLDEEIGPRKGSWKGGTVGFCETMLPGDRIADVLQRASREGRGR